MILAIRHQRDVGHTHTLLTVEYERTRSFCRGFFLGPPTHGPPLPSCETIAPVQTWGFFVGPPQEDAAILDTIEGIKSKIQRATDQSVQEIEISCSSIYKIAHDDVPKGYLHAREKKSICGDRQALPAGGQGDNLCSRLVRVPQNGS